MNQLALFNAPPPHAQSELSASDAALPRFNGPAYDHERDAPRLTGQLHRIFALMSDGRWRTLREIAAATGDPEASASAQLRHLRKPRFGSHTVEKRHRGEPSLGLYEYQLIPSPGLAPIPAGPVEAQSGQALVG